MLSFIERSNVNVGQWAIRGCSFFRETFLSEVLKIKCCGHLRLLLSTKHNGLLTLY